MFRFVHIKPLFSAGLTDNLEMPRIASPSTAHLSTHAQHVHSLQRSSHNCSHGEKTLIMPVGDRGPVKARSHRALGPMCCLDVRPYESLKLVEMTPLLGLSLLTATCCVRKFEYFATCPCPCLSRQGYFRLVVASSRRVWSPDLGIPAQIPW